MLMYLELQDYKNKHGHTRVPRNYKADPKLGYWVNTQRHNCKEQKRIDLLNKIGFAWSATAGMPKTINTTEFSIERKGGFDDKYERGVQRDKIKRKIQEEAYSSYGDKLFTQWMLMYLELHEYKHEHGHTRVPHVYAKDPKLGRWVNAQRQHCKEQNRIDLLNEIGFAWSARAPTAGMPNTTSTSIPQGPDDSKPAAAAPKPPPASTSHAAPVEGDDDS